MSLMARIPLYIVCLLLASCAIAPRPECPAGTLPLAGCPPENAVDDAQVNRLYDSRTWRKQNDLPTDSVSYGNEAKVPINRARAKVIGPTHDDSVTSLATKIWLIENAQHTIDMVYYIFKPDLVGRSVLAALCDAVKRGVDIRLMVDSVGSFNFVHADLKALGSCAARAGFMRNTNGQLTTRRARIQIVIFNSVARLHFNRRSHDKLMVVDGHFPEQSVITGGRNISLDYYGIEKDGSPDPSAFRDTEILLRAPLDGQAEPITVGSVSEIYYSLLFLYRGNRLLWDAEDALNKYNIYETKRREAADSLVFLKSLPEVRARMNDMDRFMREDFRLTPVRLAHQLHNLESKDVTTNVRENLESNPNSIDYLLQKVLAQKTSRDDVQGTLRIVSPYLFAPKYYDKGGNLVHDSAKNLLAILERNPNLNIEIVTNSVMTSDNPFAQAIIDMDMAPRLLLSSELQEQWLSAQEDGDYNSAVMENHDWIRLVQNPQLAVYQTGMLDSALLGNGKVTYGKLHAKFIIGETGGFVGTSNFDYRSMLYNNEMGFFFSDSELRDDLVDIFESLKATSYRWGSPEWLEMRKQLMESENSKASAARKQRMIFKAMRGLGIEYLI